MSCKTFNVFVGTDEWLAKAVGPLTFTDHTVRRELVSNRTCTETPPGFFSAHMATATVVHGADTTCKRGNYRSAFPLKTFVQTDGWAPLACVT